MLRTKKHFSHRRQPLRRRPRKRVCIDHRPVGYWDGGDHRDFERDYDFMLFRQDFEGSERVYFDLEHLGEIADLVMADEVPIHGSKSVLYVRTQKLMADAPDFGCWTTPVHPDQLRIGMFGKRSRPPPLAPKKMERVAEVR